MMTKKNAYTTTQKVLKVKGLAWAGFKAEHEYQLSAVNGKAYEPTTLQEAERLAGDFQRLDSATVVTITKEVKETQTFQKLK